MHRIIFFSLLTNIYTHLIYVHEIISQQKNHGFLFNSYRNQFISQHIKIIENWIRNFFIHSGQSFWWLEQKQQQLQLDFFFHVFYVLHIWNMKPKKKHCHSHGKSSELQTSNKIVTTHTHIHTHCEHFPFYNCK